MDFQFSCNKWFTMCDLRWDRVYAWTFSVLFFYNQAYPFMSVDRFHFKKAAIFRDNNFKAFTFLFSGGGGCGVPETDMK